MDFSFSDEQEAIAGLAKQILGDKATLERMTELEKGAGPRFDPELWQEMATAGLVGIAVPEQYGGAGLGFLELALIAEQVGATVAPVPFIETAIMAALPIAEFGSETQREAWLPRVANGEAVLTAALMEGESDPGKPTTTLRADGKGFRLSGTKVCVAAGQIAERVLVPATAEDGRVGIFVVDPRAQGVTVEAIGTTSSQPEAQIILDDVAVGPEDLLGDLDRGADMLAWIEERATAAQCSLALGVCAEALQLTAEYTKGREQFGQSIATFQAVGQRAADAYIDTEAIRLTSWQAAWRISEGLPATDQVAVAKYWASEAGQRVVHTASHLHGGMGVDKDYALFRYFCYAKQLELTLGGTTPQLLKIGRILAAQPAA
ncbi:MAG: acyl-CoA/acyl-ACP dehydrogenase [Deltaproteobacteria bacterium]|nr:acyl-CoA/acyl-ACP dehydrogenase [Deltaproteobacteria bacterium]